MPTIVFASPKGGVGKTTSALILATQIARAAPVTVIDADPNRPISAWAAAAREAGQSPPQLTVLGDADEDDILDRIEQAQATTPFVVVDLEGTAAKIVLLAVSQADLVLIPMQGSTLDAQQAARALKVIRQQEKMSGRRVPHAVLLTRTGFVKSRALKSLRKSLQEAGVRVMDSELAEREAFKALFTFARPLESLDEAQTPNVGKAIANAEAFAAEIAQILRQEKTTAAAAAAGAHA